MSLLVSREFTFEKHKVFDKQGLFFFFYLVPSVWEATSVLMTKHGKVKQSLLNLFHFVSLLV